MKPEGSKDEHNWGDAAIPCRGLCDKSESNARIPEPAAAPPVAEFVSNYVTISFKLYIFPDYEYIWISGSKFCKGQYRKGK
jgi:hypothetical protein